MSVLDDIFGTSSYDKTAAAKKAALTKAAGKGAEKEKQAYKTSVGKQRAALAPALTNIGDIYAQEQLGRGDYLGALGVGTPEQQAAAKAAYGNYLAPVNEYGIQDLERYGANTGTLASGGTQKDLYDYGYTTRFAPWLQALSGFNPLGANAQYGELSGKLADIEGAYGSNLANVYANKYNSIGGAQAGYFDALNAARSGAAGNVLNAGIAGANILAQGIGAAAGKPPTPGAGLSSPQYAAASGAPGAYTFPAFV